MPLPLAPDSSTGSASRPAIQASSHVSINFGVLATQRSHS
jgi:hypothetical protein